MYVLINLYKCPVSRGLNAYIMTFADVLTNASVNVYVSVIYIEECSLSISISIDFVTKEVTTLLHNLNRY